MTETEITRIAETAATEALRKFLLVIGVDASTFPATIELQKDFAHLRHTRLIGGYIGGKILGAAAGAVGTGLVAAVAFYLSRGH